MQMLRTTLMIAGLALTLPATVRAQGPRAADGPRMGLARTGVSVGAAAAAPVAEAALAPRPADARDARLAELGKPDLGSRGMPQMIIGGAAFVGGALIGGDVGTLVMLGGLGYGLYGLYIYLH